MTDHNSEAGQTMAEYAVVLAVITVAIVTMLALLGTSIAHTISSIVAAM